MKIVVELDSGKTETYNNVTDAYVCVRQLEPVYTDKDQKIISKMAFLPETRSYSWGANARELVKEIRQSLEELQNFLNRGSTL